MYNANKAQLEASLKASKGRMSDAEHRVQELELTKDAVDRLGAKVEKA